MQITFFPFLMLTLALASVAAEATLLRGGGSIASKADTNSTQRSLSVFAQEEEDGDSLSLLMTNYNVLREKGQGLLLPK